MHHLNDRLAELGLALTNMGATAEQSLAGAISTGTHGTGMDLGSISAMVCRASRAWQWMRMMLSPGGGMQVTGLRLVSGLGEVVEASRDHNTDVFSAARVGLGALGIITAIKIHCVPAFRLHMTTVKVLCFFIAVTVACMPTYLHTSYVVHR